MQWNSSKGADGGRGLCRARETTGVPVTRLKAPFGGEEGRREGSPCFVSSRLLPLYAPRSPPLCICLQHTCDYGDVPF